MKIIIAGAGEVGSHLAKMLSGEANDITVIDSSRERLDTLASNTDVVTVEGNPSSIKVLHEAGVSQADLFIAVNPSDSQDVNIVSAMLAKKLGSKKTYYYKVRAYRYKSGTKKAYSSYSPVRKVITR